MTKLETQHVLAQLAGLAPKLFETKKVGDQIVPARWALTPAQADVLAEKIEAIRNLSTEQVVVALREHVATTKFVSLQSVVECLRRVSQQTSPQRGVSPSATDPESRAGRLRQLSRETGLRYDAPAHELVLASWRNWAKVSMKIRGECPDKPYFDQFRADCMELAGMGAAEVDEWWLEIVESVRHIPIVPKMAAMERKAKGIAEAMRATEANEKAREKARVEVQA